MLLGQAHDIDNHFTNRNSIKRQWAALMETYIETLGFPVTWQNQFNFTSNFETRIRDHFLQH